MIWEYKAIIGIFVVLTAWIPLWYFVPIVPFPYLIYVLMFYGLDVRNASAFGFIISIFVLTITVYRFLITKDRHVQPPEKETLAEKRP